MDDARKIQEEILAKYKQLEEIEQKKKEKPKAKIATQPVARKKAVAKTQDAPEGFAKKEVQEETPELDDLATLEEQQKQIAKAIKDAKEKKKKEGKQKKTYTRKQVAVILLAWTIIISSHYMLYSYGKEVGNNDGYYQAIVDAELQYNVDVEGVSATCVQYYRGYEPVCYKNE